MSNLALIPVLTLLMITEVRLLGFVKSSWERLVYWALKDYPKPSDAPKSTLIMLVSIYILSWLVTVVIFTKLSLHIMQALTGKA